MRNPATREKLTVGDQCFMFDGNFIHDVEITEIMEFGVRYRRANGESQTTIVDYIYKMPEEQEALVMEIDEQIWYLDRLKIRIARGEIFA